MPGTRAKAASSTSSTRRNGIIRPRRSPHDVTDEIAAYKLANIDFPGVFGVFYENDRPTKNALEKKWIESSRAKVNNATDLELLQKTFDRMK